MSDKELVDRALQGDLEAQRALVAKLTPVIQWNVGAMLRRWRTGWASARDARQEVEDMIQEVFVELWENDSRTLRRWDPNRGLALEGFVGYVAKIRTAGFLRSPRSHWRDEPIAPEDLPDSSVDRTPEQDAISRDVLNKVYLCLLSKFSPEHLHLFDLLIIKDRSVEKAGDETGKSNDAVYKWRSRLYDKARKCLEQVSNPPPDSQRDT